MTLAGKVALVTGSSQGIGQGIVLRLAQAGADVVINYRSHPEGAEETLEKVKAIGGKCHLAECPQSQACTVQADLGNVDMMRELIAGAIETPINTKLLNDPEKLGALLKNIPLGRLGQPQDIASLVAFLASSDADYITGSTFFVDGGLLWNYQEQ